MSPVHDAANCGLCAALAAGKTHTMNGRPISPLCELCARHHFDDYPCPARRGTKDRCKCGRPKYYQDIPESARWETKAPAPMCEPCLIANGYVRHEQTVYLPEPYTAIWYELPDDADMVARVNAMSDAEFWASLDTGKGLQRGRTR